jgi:hypothetical protein
MRSVVEESKAALEARGEYVVLANISSGWFALFPSTWRMRLATAIEHGRDGPNLIVYRTKSGDPRDHHVIPYHHLRELLVEDTLARSARDGAPRWNLTLRDHHLRVTHRPGKTDVSAYFRGELLLSEDSPSVMPEELDATRLYHEGSVRRIQVNAYERDREARRKCIDHHGRRCAVCAMSFAEVYGPAAASIIHVHHLVAIATVGREYVVDPINDLRPVCPNCHAVLHSQNRAYELHEVAAMLTARKSGVSADPPA